MKSARKNKNITIDQNEFGILSLIKEGLLGTCTHLMNEKEVNEIIKSGKFKGESFPYPLSFAPKNAEEALNDIKSGDRIDLILDEKVVGHIDFKSQFKNNKNFSDIFSPNTCSLEDMGTTCISGKIEIYNSQIEKIKENFSTNQKQS